MFVCAGADLAASCTSMPNSQPLAIIVVILSLRGSCQNALPSCFFYYVLQMQSKNAVARLCFTACGCGFGLLIFQKDIEDSYLLF